jgi:effector-binding domain-containing protein
MMLEIINKPFIVTLHGFEGKVLNKDYASTGRLLMDPIWKEVKSKGIKNKGINYWVYDKNDMLFTGVELEQEAPADSAMEVKKINLIQYAYWKHIGPYSKLKNAYDAMHSELEKRNINFYYPFLEIYGHWTNAETKLETEIIFSLTRQN